MSGAYAAISAISPPAETPYRITRFTSKLYYAAFAFTHAKAQCTSWSAAGAGASSEDRYCTDTTLIPPASSAVNGAGECD